MLKQLKLLCVDKFWGQIMKCLYLVLLIVSISGVQAEFMHLPTKYDYRAVYHIKAHQIDEFSCGYNALFNGCNLETACEMQNPFCNYNQFKSVCLGYLGSKNLRPKAAASNAVIEELAQKLRMKPLYNLTFGKDGNSIEPLFVTPTKITYLLGTAEHEIQRMLKDAVAKRGKDLMQKLKTKVDSSNARCEVIHFVCIIHAQGEPHGILISLVKNASGRGLFVFDNLNISIHNHPQIQRYIDFLADSFKISSKYNFKAPKIPDVWPTTPAKKVKYIYI